MYDPYENRTYFYDYDDSNSPIGYIYVDGNKTTYSDNEIKGSVKQIEPVTDADYNTSYYYNGGTYQVKLFHEKDFFGKPEYLSNIRYGGNYSQTI